MLARAFVIIGSLIVLALFAALVGPYFVDWSSYRGDFEREASRILGRPVTVAGSATARLLPFPSVTFRDVRVAGSGDAPAMTVDEFSMDAELAPILNGEVRIFDMRLVRPKAVIAIGEDGSVDWMSRPETLFDASQIHLEHVSITDGSVTLKNAGRGRPHLVTGIQATVSARSLAGPWRIDGTMRFDGSPVALSASTGTVDENGKLRLRMQVDPKQYPAVFETDGDVRIEKAAPVYDGHFNLTARTISLDELRGAPATTKAAPPAYRVTGAFKLTHDRLGIDSFRLETGSPDNPYTADGTALVDLGAKPRFSIKATGAQVRVDEAIAGEEKIGSLTLQDRIKAFKAAVTALPMPTIPGTVELDLPAVVAGDTTIRAVQLTAEPAGGSWRLNKVAATLPGRTTLEASGMLDTDPDRFGFTGDLLLAIAQPSGFAAWVSRDVDDAIRRLPAAGFSAKVSLTEEKQSFDDLELILGDARFRGRLESENPPDRKPSFSAVLDGGALDLEGLGAFASIFVSDAGVNRFAGSDLDLTVKAGPVSAAGLTAKAVDAKLRLKDSRLDIDRLSISGLEGAEIGATGRLDGFPADPTGSVDVSVISVDLAPLLGKLAGAFPRNALLGGLNDRATVFPGLFADAELDFVASAASGQRGAKEVALDVKGTAGGTRISLTASSPDSAKLAGAPLLISLTAGNRSAAPLFALAGLPAFEFGLTGAGELKASLDGALPDGAPASISIAGADGSARFEGRVSRKAGAFGATGKLSVSSKDLGPWLTTNGLTLPEQSLGLPVSLDTEATLASGALHLSRLKGRVAGTAVTGDLTGTLADGRPHLAGTLWADHLDLTLAAAMLLGEPALTQPSSSGWPTAAIAPKGNDAFSADVTLEAGKLMLGSAATIKDASTALKLDRDGLRISDLTGTYAGGQLTGLFELKNNGGTALLSAQADLKGADLLSALPGKAVGGTGDITANLTASGKSVGALAASVAGSGTVKLRPGTTIAGLNPNAFEQLLKQADVIGRDIDLAKTQAFAPAIVSDGGFISTGADVPFTIAGGVLRTPPVKLENVRATVTADLRVDIPALTLAADGEIAYDPGEEKLVGSDPVVRFSPSGPIGESRIRFDAEPLAQFLTQRALEREQARVEAMQALLLEKQRLRREVRYYQARADERRRAEEERQRAEEQARAEAEARAAAEAQARAAAEAQAAAEAKAKAEAEEAARMEAEKAAETARQAAAEEDRRRAAEAAAREAAAPKPEIERKPLPAPVPAPGSAPEPAPGPMPQAGSTSGGFDAPTVGDFLKNSIE